MKIVLLFIKIYSIVLFTSHVSLFTFIFEFLYLTKRGKKQISERLINFNKLSISNFYCCCNDHNLVKATYNLCLEKKLCPAFIVNDVQER